MNTLVRDTWTNGITAAVKHHLKDVKKGWFNIEESNLEVYKFSKLKKFMLRINFKMEDGLRDLFYRMMKDFTNLMLQYIPSEVLIQSKEHVTVKAVNFHYLLST